MRYSSVALACLVFTAAGIARVAAHGDVTPQPVDTTGLEKLGEEWKKENPYRGNETAVQIGASGYNHNCAGCHGVFVVSGGLAPDLRYFDKGKEGDTWYVERVRKGVQIGGQTKMPSYEKVPGQEALWAIRSYIESLHVDK